MSRRHGYAIVAHYEAGYVLAHPLAMPGCLSQEDTAEAAVGVLDHFLIDRYLAARGERGAYIIPPDLPDWIGSLVIHSYDVPGIRVEWTVGPADTGDET